MKSPIPKKTINNDDDEALFAATMRHAFRSAIEQISSLSERLMKLFAERERAAAQLVERKRLMCVQLFDESDEINAQNESSEEHDKKQQQQQLRRGKASTVSVLKENDENQQPQQQHKQQESSPATKPLQTSSEGDPDVEKTIKLLGSIRDLLHAKYVSEARPSRGKEEAAAEPTHIDILRQLGFDVSQFDSTSTISSAAAGPLKIHNRGDDNDNNDNNNSNNDNSHNNARRRNRSLTATSTLPNELKNESSKNIWATASKIVLSSSSDEDGDDDKNDGDGDKTNKMNKKWNTKNLQPQQALKPLASPIYHQDPAARRRAVAAANNSGRSRVLSLVGALQFQASAAALGEREAHRRNFIVLEALYEGWEQYRRALDEFSERSLYTDYLAAKRGHLISISPGWGRGGYPDLPSKKIGGGGCSGGQDSRADGRGRGGGERGAGGGEDDEEGWDDSRSNNFSQNYPLQGDQERVASEADKKRIALFRSRAQPSPRNQNISSTISPTPPSNKLPEITSAASPLLAASTKNSTNNNNNNNKNNNNNIIITNSTSSSNRQEISPIEISTSYPRHRLQPVATTEPTTPAMNSLASSRSPTPTVFTTKRTNQQHQPQQQHEQVHAASPSVKGGFLDAWQSTQSKHPGDIRTQLEALKREIARRPTPTRVEYSVNKSNNANEANNSYEETEIPSLQNAAEKHFAASARKKSTAATTAAAASPSMKKSSMSPKRASRPVGSSSSWSASSPPKIVRGADGKIVLSPSPVGNKSKGTVEGRVHNIDGDNDVADDDDDDDEEEEDLRVRIFAAAQQKKRNMSPSYSPQQRAAAKKHEQIFQQRHDSSNISGSTSAAAGPRNSFAIPGGSSKALVAKNSHINGRSSSSSASCCVVATSQHEHLQPQSVGGWMQISDGDVRLSWTRRFLRWDPSTRRIYASSREDSLGKVLFELVDPSLHQPPHQPPHHQHHDQQQKQQEYHSFGVMSETRQVTKISVGKNHAHIVSPFTFASTANAVSAGTSPKFFLLNVSQDHFCGVARTGGGGSSRSSSCATGFILIEPPDPSKHSKNGVTLTMQNANNLSNLVTVVFCAETQVHAVMWCSALKSMQTNDVELVP